MFCATESLKASTDEADWGSKTVGTLVAADHLGRVLSAAGQLEEAEQHLRRALDGLKEAWMGLGFWKHFLWVDGCVGIGLVGFWWEIQRNAVGIVKKIAGSI